MPQGWMIRAGEGGRLFDLFESRSCVAVGWNALGDLQGYGSIAKLRQAYIEHHGNAKPGRTGNAVAMIHKFCDVIQQGDTIITYSPELREYLVGTDQGQYEFLSTDNQVEDYAQIRRVKWEGKVSRDVLTQSTRNSLGSTLALFSLSDPIINEMRAALEGKQPVLAQEPEEVEADLVQLSEHIRAQSHELIKDRILQLTPEDMEHFAAAILRAMGYRTKVSPRGPDRGVDVEASPDGLGLTKPHIKVEIKHRSGSMGSTVLRSFITVVRSGQNGIFVSTGGFTREARYEAERAPNPITLVDLDDLASLAVENYPNFDTEDRALLPLMHVYWPAD
ncbi:restriction endonuclease [Vreelandella aquamarina]|uniref:restriction endonuclease n=1 Tax=Vreelandella aquamarina TaxID=77097 RepID=UPI0006966E6A|nr:restriction endonuclease [Halomonas meridiana]